MKYTALLVAIVMSVFIVSGCIGSSPEVNKIIRIESQWHRLNPDLNESEDVVSMTVNIINVGYLYNIRIKFDGVNASWYYPTEYKDVQLPYNCYNSEFGSSYYSSGLCKFLVIPPFIDSYNELEEGTHIITVCYEDVDKDVDICENTSIRYIKS